MTYVEEDWPSAPTIHQLRAFLVLAEELHFGRAATRLYMSQPALSRQLGALERRLGVEVIARTSRSAAITPAGSALLPDALAVVRAATRLRRIADNYSRGLTGKLIIGTVGAEAAMEHTTVVLEALRQRHPALELDIRLLDLGAQFRSLTTGEVDAVFCRPPAPDEVKTHHLQTEPRVVCLPAGDPLAGRDRVTLAELDDRVMISFPPESPQAWRDFWAADPRPSGVPVTYGPMVRDMEALFAEIARGGAISFQPAAARQFFPRPGVAYVAVSDLPPCTSALAWHITAENRPVVKAIRQAAEDAWPIRASLPTVSHNATGRQRP
ncbi:LysR family transcriptional regulator [Amycolatopsis sp. A133]|uniref:LysR family transcriptional regulator n=1 Tax=Amycolatopsis sp. A133 TaxID=3064472 RepID=UPI0027F4ADA4|nr:LysR family transcriptional regulator [Amycolatopsis sp. A133]MDQ7809114.1 LysR family transcriptional regulator [Amycolatopsis sp. A133]